jgi:hypothetical protein
MTNMKPTAAITYALPPAPPESVTTLWVVDDGERAQRGTTDPATWCIYGAICRWHEVLALGPLTTVQPELPAADDDTD